MCCNLRYHTYWPPKNSLVFIRYKKFRNSLLIKYYTIIGRFKLFRDEENSMSSTRLILRIGNAPISWLSNRRSCVALYLVEVDYMDLLFATRKSVWLKKLTQDLGLNYI